MKINNDFIKSLINESDPIPIIWKYLLKIWLDQNANNLKEFYYNGEEEAVMFEDFILKTYDEFFKYVLPKACLNETSPFHNTEDYSFIVMDGMSIREGILIYKTLEKKGLSVKLHYTLSAVPSDTLSFREKIKPYLTNNSKFIEINNPNKIRISENTKYVWSYFPDVMLDKIKVGRTVISSLENMYGSSEKIVLELVNNIKSNKIVILSDHGYIRSEAGFSFSVPDEVKVKLRDVFGSSRYVSMNKSDASELVDKGYVVEISGNYLIKSRYIWPVPGKYNIYLHGGISLMECYTPIIEVYK